MLYKTKRLRANMVINSEKFEKILIICQLPVKLVQNIMESFANLFKGIQVPASQLDSCFHNTCFGKPNVVTNQLILCIPVLRLHGISPVIPGLLTGGPPVVHRCTVPLFDRWLSMEMKISKTAYALDNPIFLRLHNANGSSSFEI